MLTSAVFMAVSGQVAPLPACILPIFGIPGSGKTLLTRHLVVSADVALQWNLIAVHFDDLYPPDLRSQEDLFAQSRGEVRYGTKVVVNFSRGENLIIFQPSWLDHISSRLRNRDDLWLDLGAVLD